MLIKQVKRIFLISGIVLISLVTVVYVLLWLPPVQQKIVNIALHEVSKKTGNRMIIGDIRLKPFNSLKLSDVYAADLQGDTLAYIENLSTQFRLWPLLRSRLVIQSVSLDNFTVNLWCDSIGAPLNYQFFIDAFASDDTTTSESNFAVEIDNIRLSRGRFSYDVRSAALRDSVFDAGHIRMSGLEADIYLRSIDLEKLDAGINHLSFKEQSGLSLENLSATLTSEGKVLDMADLELRLPHSLLRIPQATVDYTGMELGNLADSAKYTLLLDIPYFRLTDVTAFAPFLDNVADSISLQSRISGRFPGVNIDSLVFSYGKGVDLEMAASLADFKRWDTAPLELDISRLAVSSQGFADIEAATKNTLAVHNENVQLTANVAGSLPDLRLRLSAVSIPAGRLDITGNGGYVFHTGETRFDLKMSANRFNLNSLLNSSPFGFVTLNLETSGEIDKSGRIDATADMNVDRFDFRQYSYRDISISAGYTDKNATFRLSSHDGNAPILICAEAVMSETPTASLYLKTSNLKLSQLNLIPNYKGADLSTALKVNVEGFDPEQMTARVRFDSLCLSSDKRTTALETISLDYNASDNSKKQFALRSKLIDVGIDGKFSLNTIAASFQNTIAAYFPRFVESKAMRKKANDSLEINIALHNAEQWAEMTGVPFAVIDTATLKASYSSRNDHLAMTADFPQSKLNDMVLNDTRLSLQADTANKIMHLEVGAIRFAVSDTVHLGLAVETLADSLRLGLNFDLYTPQIKAGGEIGMAAAYKKVAGQKMPDIFVDLFPSQLNFNGKHLHIRHAHLMAKNNEYEVDNFEIALSDSEFLKVNGRVSRNEQDTLRINIGRLQIGTLTDAFGAGLNIAGEINGDIKGSSLLTSPRILTEDFSVRNIMFEDQLIGDIDLVSGWSEQFKAVVARASLSRDSARTSVINGIIFPQKDSLSVNADFHDLQLAWINPFTKSMLYGVGGNIGVRIRAEGKMKSPDLSGAISLKDVRAGVSMLNVQYGISDSIQIYPDRLVMKDFRITDEKQQQAVINGEVLHTGFSDIRPALTMNLQDFLLLNNPQHTDSLFNGILRVSGTVGVESAADDILLKVAIRNSPGSKITVNLPDEKANEARLYQSVTFVNKDSLQLKSGTTANTHIEEIPMPKLPLRLQLALEVTPELQLAAVYNPKTKDAATIKGSGNIDFDYNMATSRMNLLGDYKISEGKATVSLKNITKRVFTVLPGGVVNFKGDPMATEFNITAVYELRADLTTLDPVVFGDANKTRVNTECHIQVSGNLDKMSIGYKVVIPDEDEGIQRRVDALMPTDDIRLKEIAYLLVFGSFYPPTNTDGVTSPGSNIWTSIASSAITSQLNSLLDGVLSDNWTIGTELHSDDASGSDIEMDVNISTRLLNDRLTVTSNIGYKNTSTSTSNTNFTGDFDVQYKLTKSGNLVLKMYNVTNDRYYDQAQSTTTQGVGLLYRRESKRFRDLFKRTKKAK